ncbi:hypothetical protein B0T25DRAFT_174228 [Lasiosphaeria hispida]|uniref:Uncharacterized protein n=1 Tax=Lasiosphaeria hispida TaxID=260671 RepID=A0AAJ0HN27_9PEZI|nr:hypothetical protein B0T25DRAFT_174228 [Lasiosphaeria hispida]
MDLHDTSNPIDSGVLAHKHLPGRTGAHYLHEQSKAPRRPFHWSQSKVRTRHENCVAALADFAGTNTRTPAPHHLTLFAANVAHHRRPASFDRAREFRARQPWAGDVIEGCVLAREPGVRLPGERRRPPSLERQNAFRDARTVKRMGLKRGFSEDGADEAELYRLGLLYDDEHERGSAFSLNAIVHDDPVWNVKFKEERRGKKKQRQRGFGEVMSEGEVVNLALDLALSFAAFGDDEALAAFLIGADEAEGAESVFTHLSSQGSSQRSSQRSASQVTVSYDLEESTGEDEMESAEGDEFATAETNFPDLVSNAIHCYRHAHEEEDNGEWAFLDGSNSVAGESNSVAGDDNSDTAANRDGDTDAWVVLSSDGS